MSYPCQDCGKVLATEGGLDVHRAQWCSGMQPVAPVISRREARRLGLRRRARNGRLRPVPTGDSATGEADERDDDALVTLTAAAPAEPAEDRFGVPADPEGIGEPAQLLEPAIDLRGEGQAAEISLIMWLMQRRVHRERLPPGRTVVRFDFTGARTESYWLLLDPPDVQLSITSPRLAIDVVVDADAGAFRRVFLGRMRLADALADDLVHFRGADHLVRSIPRWFEWSRPIPARTIGG